MELFAPVPQPILQQAHRPVPVSVVMIPYWIQQVLDRNKLNYIDALNYDAMRRILSIEDMAQLKCCNLFDNQSILGKILSFGDLALLWQDKMSAENRAEYDNVVCPLSYSEASKIAVAERLTYLDAPSIPSFENIHRIQVMGSTLVFVFVQRGLLNALENRDYAKALVSDYLKALYSLMPIRDVSNGYPAFEMYFDLL